MDTVSSSAQRLSKMSETNPHFFFFSSPPSLDCLVLPRPAPVEGQQPRPC